MVIQPKQSACYAHAQALSAGVLRQPRQMGKHRRGNKGSAAKQGKAKAGSKTGKTLRELAELVNT